MAENVRPPVAVRIVRPYETEEAFLEAELETVGKTSVILIGAHSRPTGVILRFEVTLATGHTVLRGEGRVLAHKEAAFRGQPGLALRFTRLDPKSKSLVDRAAAIREARLAGESFRPGSGPAIPPPEPDPTPEPTPQRAVRTSSIPPSVSARSTRPGTMSRRSFPPAPDPALAEVLTSPTPVPPRPVSQLPSMPPLEPPPSLPPEAADSADDEPVVSVVVAESSGAIEADESAPEIEQAVPETTPASVAPSPPSVAPSPPSIAPMPASVAPPPPVPPASLASPGPQSDRDGLLSRLRQRAAGLSDEQKAAILRSR